MAGLILFFILGIWLLITISISWLITKIIKNKLVRYFVIVLIIPILFLLPVVDEIIGRVQFEQLCEKEAIFTFDEALAKGKTVYFSGSITRLTEYAVPIEKLSHIYKEFEKEKTVIAWTDFRAKGGILSHLVDFPEDNPPYTFNGFCSANKDIYPDFEKLKITVKDK